MARRTQKTHNELRAAVQAAIDGGTITPTDVIAFLLDNGFDPMPTRSTVIVVMRECGVEYISGYWVRTK